MLGLNAKFMVVLPILGILAVLFTIFLVDLLLDSINRKVSEVIQHNKSTIPFGRCLNGLDDVVNSA